MTAVLTLVGGAADSVVEIVGPDTPPRQVDVPARASVPVTLDPGPYTCRAVRPGRPVARWAVDLDAHGARVEVDGGRYPAVPVGSPASAGPPVVREARTVNRAESPVPWPETGLADAFADVLDAQPEPRRRSGFPPWGHPFRPPVPPPVEPVLPAGLWGALWTWDGRWRPAEWSGGTPRPDGAGFVVDLRSTTSALHAVQVGAADAPARVVVLPPAPHPSLVLRSAPPGGLHGGLRVDVRSGVERADRLLAYDTAGLLEQSTALSGWVDEAESLLRGKVADPVGAAVGGYHLLRTGRSDRLHDWPANFTRLFPWLPDAAALAVGRTLAVQRPLPVADLVDLLRGAVRAGPPVWSQGLRIVYDALQLLGPTATGALLDTVRPLATAVDWDVPSTTFRATDPNRPVLHGRTGPPPARLRHAVRFG